MRPGHTRDLRSRASFSGRLLSPLRDEFVDEAYVGGNLREPPAEAREDRPSAFEHEPIIFGFRDEDVACLDAEPPSQRRRHHKPSLPSDRDLDRLSFCHRTQIVPHIRPCVINGR